MMTSFGPSDWIRTSGLLNPIQARYQTSPHPDIHLLLSDSSDILAWKHGIVKPQFSIFGFLLRAARGRPEWIQRKLLTQFKRESR